MSVVMPVLNGASTISEQLAALARQTADPFEVLVCDNGSTDGTKGIVEAWMDRIPSLRWMDASAARGPAHARNAGIRAARGEILVFCDADDVVADDWLAAHGSASQPGVVGCGSEEFARLNPGRAHGVSSGLILREGYLYGLDSANFSMRRADLLRIGGFDESCRYVEDVDLAWRAQQAGMTVISVPALVHSRLRQSDRGVFRQRRNWARYSILLRARTKHRAPMPMSFRYTGTTLVRTLLAAPLRLLCGPAARRRLAETLGALIGEFDGHLRYRFLGAPPPRRLVEPEPGRPQIRRVFFAVDDLGNLGGVQSVVDALAGEMNSRGLEIGYITINPMVNRPLVAGQVFEINKHESRTADHSQAASHPGPLGLKLAVKRALVKPWRIWRSRRYRNFVASFGPETAIVFTSPGSARMLRDAGYVPQTDPFERPFLVSQLHTSIAGMRAWGWQDLTQQVLSYTDVFLALCPADASDFASHYGRPIGVMRNPAPPGIAPAGAPREPVVAYFGRLSGEKRVQLLLQAFAEASSRVPGWSLRLYGDGAQRKELEEIAKALGAPIHFLGRISDVPAALGEVSLCLLTSSFEGVPMSIIEAAAAGVPTVSTLASPGTAELVEECGFPVHGDDASSIAEVLAQAMGNPTLLASRAAACASVAARHDVGRVVDAWEALFHDRSLSGIERAEPSTPSPVVDGTAPQR